MPIQSDEPGAAMNIEPGRPSAIPRRADSRSRATLSEFVEEAFPMETDDAILSWNGIPVSLSYKYDIAVVIDEIEEVIEGVSEGVEDFAVVWPSNTFQGHWQVSVTENLVGITAQWQELAHGKEALLNEHPEVSMSTDDFLWEWAKLLTTLRRALLAAGYSTTDCVEWHRLERLIELCEQHPG